MEALMEILENLHPEIDFNTCDTLIDDRTGEFQLREGAVCPDPEAGR